MTNIITDFKKYLQFLQPKDQIYEINFMIDYFNKSNRINTVTIIVIIYF